MELAHYQFHSAHNNQVKKEASNVAKHGVSFSEAQTAFTDEFARLIPDPDHSEDEDRFILLGTSIFFFSQLLRVTSVT